MSEAELYYEAFCHGWWKDEEDEKCACRGSGWALSQVDTWHKCPIHWNGQRHPEEEEE